MLKKFKFIAEFEKMEATENGGLPLGEVGLFMKEVGQLAKKYNFTCGVKTMDMREEVQKGPIYKKNFGFNDNRSKEIDLTEEDLPF